MPIPRPKPKPPPSDDCSEGDRTAMLTLLADARARRATDLHLIGGSPISLRIDGSLTTIDDRCISPDEARRLACALLSPEEIAQLETRRDLDVIRLDPDGRRHRMNVAYNHGTLGAVIRILPAQPPTLDALRLPPIVEALSHRGKGLILVTGSTSMGKTTTMASLLDQVNRTYGRHIVTIEDPIEYVHTNHRSVVRQREVGRDTLSFADGLRAALRQDPDVILVGEMRDYETIEIALRAAESGVLVISTLHIVSVDRLMDRLLSYCPPGRELLLRTMMSEVLLAVIHQELLPSTDGGKRVACEVLVATRAVRNILRSSNETQLRSIMQTGASHGMVEMSASLGGLLMENAITEEQYERVMRNYAALA